MKRYKKGANSISKSMMIPRRLGGGDEAYYIHTLRKPMTTPTKVALDLELELVAPSG